MENHTRKFIDYLRRSLIGPLLVTLVLPLTMSVHAANLLGSPWVRAASALALLPTIVLMLAFGLVGMITSARTRRPNKGRSPLEQLQRWNDADRIGLYALEEPLDDAPPPPVMQHIVHALGGRGPGWLSVCEVVLMVTTMVAWQLIVVVPADWLHATLQFDPGDENQRLRMALALSGVFALFVIRGWAVAQRRRLEANVIGQHHHAFPALRI